MTIKVAVYGAAGRMGRTLIQLIRNSSEFELSGAFEQPNHPAIGQPAGIEGFPISPMPRVAEADALIDFSSPEGTAELIERLLINGKPYVCGTTGLSAVLMDRMRLLAGRQPVVWSPNFSVGVNLLLDLTKRAARTLGAAFDAEIMEVHHRHKKDAPSGTAQALAAALATATGLENGDAFVHGRSGLTGERSPYEIGVHALRGGEVVGEHTVFFLGSTERLELTHRAGGREAFAAGALRAAAWACRRSPGLYSMPDVLELERN